jgi:phosphoribosylanthranilate isomerase
VKVCGITRAEDAAAAVEAGADLLGFNFCSASPRYISPAEAAPIVRMLPRQVLAVGVFVDPDADAVRRAIETAGIGLLQLHGDEPPEFCHAFGVPAMKALRVARLADLDRAAAVYADGWLLADTAHPLLYGGTGRALAPEPVSPALARRLFVAGGLLPETVADVVRRVRPLGVDVCSGVELSPGTKDAARLRSFVSNAKAA